MTIEELLEKEMASLKHAIVSWSVSARNGAEEFEPRSFSAGFSAGVFECFKYLTENCNPHDGSAFSYALDQFFYTREIKDQVDKRIGRE